MVQTMCVPIQSLWVRLSLPHADLEDSLVFLNSQNMAYSQDQESQLILLYFLDIYWCVLLGVTLSTTHSITTHMVILLWVWEQTQRLCKKRTIYLCADGTNIPSGQQTMAAGEKWAHSVTSPWIVRQKIRRVMCQGYLHGSSSSCPLTLHSTVRGETEASFSSLLLLARN